MMDMLQPLAAVVLVLALLGGALWLLRRRGLASFNGPALRLSRPGSESRQLALIERISLGGQNSLHLVRVGERRILVATAPGTCQLLDAPVDEGSAR